MEKRYTENLIPLMTSYTTPFGKVDYGGDAYLVYGGYNYEPYHLFGTGQFSSASSKGIWVSYEFEKPERIVKYTLRTHSWLYERSPKSWTFDAWDGTQWIVLDARDNQPQWTNTDKREYEIKNSYYYKKYRINLKNSWGSYIHLSRMEMMGELPNKSFILHEGEYKKFNPKILGKDPKIDVVPKMTSDTSPLGKVTARGAYNPAWQAFDKDSSTYWYDNGSSASNPSWLQYEFDSPKIINKIALDSLIITGSAYGIKEFTLLGSNDGLNYDSLLSVDNHPNRSTKETYQFNNKNEYLIYKLKFGLSYHNYYTLVSSFEMYEMATPNTPAFWSTISTTVPTSNQFIEKGIDSLFPLLNRTLTQLEPFPMIQRNDILVSGEVGKVFSKTIDLKKYFDIRSIRTEVK